MTEDNSLYESKVDSLLDDVHDLVRGPSYKDMMLSEVIATLELAKFQLLEAWHHTR